LSPLRAREGQAVVLPVATGSLANAIGRAKTAPGSRACFLSGISGSRVGAEESGAA
jgi:hypothetical protein